MRKLAFVLLAAAASAALIFALASRGGSPSAAQASSHREAPLISEDPSADSTDTYAFRSPDKPDTVTLIANLIPGEDPAAGPNWYTFSPSARYDIYADKSGDGKDFFAGYAVHAISLQVPLSQLDNGGNHIVGIWSATDRPKLSVTVKGKKVHRTTRWVQVSRLGNPLINELLIPTQLKDKWNATTPDQDKQWEQYYSSPVLAHLLNVLYPSFGTFPETGRSDLVAVLLTGLQNPALNYTGPTEADELRLNLVIKPTAPVGKGNRLGVLGSDLAGFPNGRRLEDDVIDIGERAIGGAL